MSDLTDKWKAGDMTALSELVEEIKKVDYRCSLSDEYLKANNLSTREEHCVAGEFPYGIVMVISDYILPYLKELQTLQEENVQQKQLLKEVKEFIEEENPKDFTIMSERMDELLTKIAEMMR